MKLAIVGAGWAGMAAAVQATAAGHTAIIFEAAHAIGGRARALKPSENSLDNGQHILIGAYSECLRLMREVGVNPEHALLRLPLSLPYPDGQGLALPRWPAPLDALAGILGARGWSWADKWSLLRTAAGWQRQGFVCAPATTVAELCRGLSPRINQTLIDPLCVSALNTPADAASGQVFLRVMQDSLLGGTGASNLLLPRVDLSALFPQPAAQWVQARGARLHLGHRVNALHAVVDAAGAVQGWQIGDETFDAVVWATSPSNAAQALMECAQAAPEFIANGMRTWAQTAAALRYEAIATVYVQAPGVRLTQPMLALRGAPAQFVFDRGQLGGPAGLLAFVVSASQGSREEIEAQVLVQAREELGNTFAAVQTVVEKRATFACTPNLARPPMHIAAKLLACGDYVQGPYPATLEGAVRSGCEAIAHLALHAPGP